MVNTLDFEYDRRKAVDYADYWAYRRNPKYYNFTELGGDCTNFVSQCLYAGSGIMNYTPLYGWYYLSAQDRTPSWTGVGYLYDFLLNNQGDGPYGRIVDIKEIQRGDICQLRMEGEIFDHSALITGVDRFPTLANTYVATHSNDANCRPLDTYPSLEYRFIHIEGVRYLSIK